MLFNQLKTGDSVYIIEVIGTFKKTTEYNVGSVVSVSGAYDEPLPKEPTNTEDPRIKELQDEVNELKNIIKQASSMVPPPMKQMLPQNMQNVMKEVDQ